MRRGLSLIHISETNEYKGETRAYISPREGTYPLPANATLSEPPAIVERKARCWNEETGAWEQVDDYRGETYWNKMCIRDSASTDQRGRQMHGA